MHRVWSMTQAQRVTTSRFPGYGQKRQPTPNANVFSARRLVLLAYSEATM